MSLDHLGTHWLIFVAGIGMGSLWTFCLFRIGVIR